LRLLILLRLILILINLFVLLLLLHKGLEGCIHVLCA
jgi:hypothetical protein